MKLKHLKESKQKFLKLKIKKREYRISKWESFPICDGIVPFNRLASIFLNWKKIK